MDFIFDKFLSKENCYYEEIKPIIIELVSWDVICKYVLKFQSLCQSKMMIRFVIRLINQKLENIKLTPILVVIPEFFLIYDYEQTQMNGANFSTLFKHLIIYSLFEKYFKANQDCIKEIVRREFVEMAVFEKAIFEDKNIVKIWSITKIIMAHLLKPGKINSKIIDSVLYGHICKNITIYLLKDTSGGKKMHY